MPDANRTIDFRLRRSLSTVVLVVLAACGSPSGNSNATPQPPAASTAASTVQKPTSPGAAAPTETRPTASPVTKGVQESTATGGGEQIHLASAGDPGMLARFREGQDFKVLTAAQGTSSSPGKIEVTEVFWYGCPHCYQFDPLLHDWVKKLPADVSFVQLPVMWNPTNQMHARLFYTAQALGKLEEMHTAIFREIHLNGKTLTTEDEIQSFFGKFGVSAGDFQKTFRSFAVEGQLKRARDLTQRYQIRSVPVMVVNGKFSSDAPGIKNFEDMLAVVSDLVERERQLH
jgi:thiol:disulfide interchange protein DsbA